LHYISLEVVTLSADSENAFVNDGAFAVCVFYSELGETPLAAEVANHAGHCRQGALFVLLFLLSRQRENVDGTLIA